MFVDVAFVIEPLVAEKVLVVLVSVRSPPMPTLPVMVAVLAVKLATVVEPAVRVPRPVAPVTERLDAEMEVPEIEPPVKDEPEIATPFSWSILFVCAMTR